MLIENLRRRLPVESVLPAHALAHFCHDFPVGPRTAGHRQHGALTADRAVRTGDRAGFFRPCRCRQEHVGQPRRIGAQADVGNDHERARGNRAPHPVGIGHRDGGIGMHDPQGLDPAVRHRIEHIDRFQPLLLWDGWRFPEIGNRFPVRRIGQFQVTGERVGQSADFAAAHRIGLSGDGKRPHARPPDPAGRKMAVDHRIDLVGAGRGLIDALAKERDRLFVADPQVEESRQIFFGKSGHGGIVGHGGSKRCLETARMRSDIGLIGSALPRDLGQQAIEQCHIAANRKRQMQIGAIAGGRAAGIDDDELHLRPRIAGGRDPLIEHRMTPGEVGPDENHEIRLFQIFVDPRHGVGAERPLVPGHGRRHAQAGVGVDIRAADEALHQLVGDVIIFGEQLAGHVECGGIGPMLGAHVHETRRHKIESFVPRGVPAADLRGQLPLGQPDGLAERRALGTQAPAIVRMVRIASDRKPAIPVRPEQDAAADPAIGAGRSRFVRLGSDHQAAACSASAPSFSSTRPSLYFTG